MAGALGLSTMSHDDLAGTHETLADVAPMNHEMRTLPDEQ